MHWAEQNDTTTNDTITPPNARGTPLLSRNTSLKTKNIPFNNKYTLSTYGGTSSNNSMNSRWHLPPVVKARNIANRFIAKHLDSVSSYMTIDHTTKITWHVDMLYGTIPPQHRQETL